MNNDEVARRKKISFAQAEGLEPLPSQLQRTEVSSELRAVLWGFIYDQIYKTIRRETYTYVGEAWTKVLRSVHIFHEHLLADEFSNRFSKAIEPVKLVFEKGNYVDIYGWLQFVLRQKPSADFAKQLEVRLRYCRAPYRVVDGEILYPVGSDEDADTIKAAFANLKESGLLGSREHLKTAASALTEGQFADSVRESVHAVESAVRVLEPSGDFSKALSKLEQKTNIHGALKKGFVALYGFSSDEQGIRHPLLDKESPAVDEADAMFMIGACSAFLSYLVNKSRTAGLLGGLSIRPPQLSSSG
jgi:hypothetical protein